MKHPAIIASLIITSGLLGSAALIAASLHSLASSIEQQVFASSLHVPSDLNIHSPTINATIQNTHDQPFLIHTQP